MAAIASETKMSAEVQAQLKMAQAGDAWAQAYVGWCFENGKGVTKDLRQGVVWYRRAAEQGNATAQYNLGVCFANGEGVAKDEQQAVVWYRTAAEQGNATAQSSLGRCLEVGQGVAKDKRKAVEWYRKAAEQGNATAQFWLGRCLEVGQGVAKDKRKAVEWYRTAAEQGNATAQFALGGCFEMGQGVDIDERQAVEWYRQAAEQGLASAQFYLGGCFEMGQGVDIDERQAMEWYHKAAEQGHAKAQSSLGHMLSEGRGITKDEKQAVEWYRKAAEQGYAKAQHNLGYALANGQGVAKDEKQAVEWYRKAAEQGNATAQFNLGVIFGNGLGVNIDERQAVEWFRKAAEQGMKEAQFNLGVKLASGRGIAKDERQAMEWYRKAAEQGYANAQFNLGNGLRNGKGVDIDERQAVEWFRKAAEQGVASAQVNLGCMLGDGEGVAKDERQAVEWFRKAAEQGNATAQFNLGVKLAGGRGIAKDERQAMEWFHKAAEQGHADAKRELERLQASLQAASLATSISEKPTPLVKEFSSAVPVLIANETKMSEEVKAQLKMAQAGNAQAQSYIGWCFANGEGIAKDDRQAVEWFHRAALQGNADAQYYLGKMLRWGEGVAKDERQAVEWIRKAAEQDHVLALMDLDTTKPDTAERKKKQEFNLTQKQEKKLTAEMRQLLNKAQSGNVVAQFNLGEAFYNGKGVSKDRKQAAEWYHKAALQGHAQAQCNYGVSLEEDLGDMKGAIIWYRKAAAQGNADAQYYLGIVFEEGLEVTKDERQAVEWYCKAAVQGHAKAKTELERLQIFLPVSPPLMSVPGPTPVAIMSNPAVPAPLGSEIKMNTEVEELLTKAEAGDVKAQYELGLYFANGWGVAKDLRQAVEWYRKAAELRHAGAQYNLGVCFGNGQGVIKDLRQAVEWYRKAAEQGYAQAQYTLGWCFEKGEGVAKDERQAVEWVRKAAEQGLAQAKIVLERLQASVSRVTVTTPATTTSLRTTSSTSVVSSVSEAEQHQESKTSQEQQGFIEALQKTGLTPAFVEQLIKNIGSPLSSEESKAFAEWKEAMDKNLAMLQRDLSDTHKILGLGPEIKALHDYIESKSTLKAYHRRFEQEFSYYALCYSLFPAGVMLEGNKKDAMISAMSAVPEATMQGVPFIGPLLGKVFGLIPQGLKFANRKHRMKQANQIKELFGGLREISKISYLLSLELTWAKRLEIEAYEKIEYEGFAKIKGLYEKGKELLMQQWKDLITSDKRGLKLTPAEELAVLDCAFIMQQVSVEAVHMDASREPVPQLVALVTGKSYIPIVLPSTPKINASPSPTRVASSAVTPLTPVSPVSPAPMSEVEALKQLVREQQEALRRQQIEGEAARAETKALAEKLAKVQKQLQPTDVDGGREAIALQKPESSSSSVSAVSHAEFHALKQHVTSMTHTVMETKDQVEAVSLTVYNLQDGKKTDRGKAGSKQITQARDFALLEAERKMKEETARAAGRAKAKKVFTAQDLM